MHLAVFNNHFGVVQFLIPLGVVNVRDGDGCTPLHIASGNGNKKIAEILLQNGSNVNEANEDILF